ncbi:MAG: hypothetical protein AAFV07_19545, partial [Bacteroidota bacterium]
DQLSNAAWAALQNPDYLPLKHLVTGYLEAQLLSVEPRLREMLKSPSAKNIPEFLRGTGGRLSRGEAYLQQPYRVYDMPRYFAGGHIFLFRSLVLWGHHLSFHLILTGEFAAKLGPVLITRRRQIPAEWILATHATPWVWDRAAPGWHTFANLSNDEIQLLSTKVPYCKISRFYPLSSVKQLPDLAAKNWQFWQDFFHEAEFDILLPTEDIGNAD